MNRPNSTDEPATEQEFRRALRDVILTARDNDVRVRGHWVVDGEDAPTDFEVGIHPVVKN